MKISGPVGGGKYQVSDGPMVLGTAPSIAEAEALATRLETEATAAKRAILDRASARYSALLRATWWGSPIDQEPRYNANCAAWAGMKVRGRLTHGYRERGLTVSMNYRIYATGDQAPDDRWTRLDPASNEVQDVIDLIVTKDEGWG